ncbi:MAG: lysylphosphatidylglycerol synthase domain-containing protein [Candidatus Omnitrophica bacterium]|nr:lysylphosphatidylglycerol synthase domain-containing protein [Candidatus Omnitrophota bacterium]
MYIQYFFIAVILAVSALVSSLIFWILLKRKIHFLPVLKLFCVSASLNRLLVTGSGYAVLSWRLKLYGISIHTSLAVSAVSELLSIAPWLILGIYCGSSVAVHIPWAMVVLSVLIVLFLILKLKHIRDFAGKVFGYIREAKIRIIISLPFVIINIVLVSVYYLLLVHVFLFDFNLLQIIRIVAISIAAGYLSPVPSGIGIKEGSLIYLLMREGVGFQNACVFALTDRLIVTIFYIAAGFIAGTDIIIGELKKKYFKQRDPDCSPGRSTDG